MTAVDVVSYDEASNQDVVRSLPLAHLSVEVGHFYMDELLNGEEPIRRRFAAAAPWIEAARASARAWLPAGRTLRMSTCFLIDDYFYPHTNPAEVMPRLLRAARETGVEIDYVAREAGCQRDGRLDLAQLTARRLLEEPAPRTNGSRPPAHLSGWLANGRRSTTDGADEALRAMPWASPEEFGRRNHSIFLDVEMWREAGGERKWSCAFLAGVWHLLRLGVLRHHGEPVATPVDRTPHDEWPESWSDLPSVMRLRPSAPAFSAYQVLSVLPGSYLPIEHAIRVLLGHLTFDGPVIDQLVARGASEGVKVPAAVNDRISHVFIEG
jgi:hypothetical protein